jgi:hypothetical protein
MYKKKLSVSIHPVYLNVGTKNEIYFGHHTRRRYNTDKQSFRHH